MRVSVQQAIAVLDSGVGGFTVAKEIMRQLPKEEIIYFGDTARAPYGPRTPNEVLVFTRQIVKYLLTFEPKMIVIACNTATAAALQTIQEEVSLPVIGVIHPGVRGAIKHSLNKIVGVIGTEGTIKSGAYDSALKETSPGMRVVSLACPRFVPLVEKGLYCSNEAKHVVRESLAPLKSVPMDCLILGCTHYPFLSRYISDAMGPNVRLINSADETAREVSAILFHRGQLNQNKAAPWHRFFCSGDPIMFEAIVKAWLGRNISVIKMVLQATSTA